MKPQTTTCKNTCRWPEQHSWTCIVHVWQKKKEKKLYIHKCSQQRRTFSVMSSCVPTLEHSHTVAVFSSIFWEVLHPVVKEGSTRTQTWQVNISISKFIADMHVEIWWSRKICFLYKRVFICTITQFSVSRCPCLTKQLTTHYPIGFKTTPHFISYTKFPVETVSNIEYIPTT